MPDLNIWLALSWANHRHSTTAWQWLSSVPDDEHLLFCRFTQIGLLRVLATSAIMGDDLLSIAQGWSVYDRWLEDARVSLRQESFELETAFRSATRPVTRLASPKALGDCYLLAAARTADATLVTFDQGLASACKKAKQPMLLLA